MALVLVLMVMMLMTALGSALMLTTMTEGRIASNYRDGTEALYAADAAVERVIQDILTVPDWNSMLAAGPNGQTSAAQSAFVDGAPGDGWRTLPDGSRLNLLHATNMLNCGKTAVACTDTDMAVITDERPWAANNPQWKLYAHAPITDVLPTPDVNSLFYVVVWVADDPSENDNLPLKDGEVPPTCDQTKPETCVNGGRGVIAMRAQSYGPGGVQRTIEVTLARTDTTEIERGYTGQRGQDEQNRRARKAAVQTPGKKLTQTSFGTGA